MAALHFLKTAVFSGPHDKARGKLAARDRQFVRHPFIVAGRKGSASAPGNRWKPGTTIPVECASRGDCFQAGNRGLTGPVRNRLRYAEPAWFPLSPRARAAPLRLVRPAPAAPLRTSGGTWAG